MLAWSPPQWRLGRGRAPLVLASAREPVPAIVRVHYSPFFLGPLGRYAESLVDLNPRWQRSRSTPRPGRPSHRTVPVGRIDEGLAEFELVCGSIRGSRPPSAISRASTPSRPARRGANVRRAVYTSVPHHPNAAFMLAASSNAPGIAIGPDRSSKHTAASAPRACRAPAPKLPGLRRVDVAMTVGTPVRTRSRRLAPVRGQRPGAVARYAALAGSAGDAAPATRHSVAAADETNVER